MRRLITNQGLLQIFFALLLVIAVMFSGLYLVYKNSISGIYDKIIQNNTLVTKSIVQSFDNTFMSINNLIYSVQGLAPRDKLSSSIDGRIDMSQVYTMITHLSNLTATSEYVEEIAVFYNDADLVITSRGTSNMQQFFNNKYRHPVYNASYWKTYASGRNPFKVFPSDTFRVHSELNQQTRSKELMIAFSGNRVYLSNKNIMVLIDMNALMKHIKLQSMIPGASLIVLDQNRNIIFSTDKNLNLLDVLNDVYFDSSHEATLTKENYEYNFYRSEYNEFIYIDKVPYQFQNIDSVAKANYMIALTAIVCAIILALFLSIYLYKPVKNILGLLGSGHIRGNDFRKIYSGIIKIQRENDDYKLELSGIDLEMRKLVLLQALDPATNASEHDVQLRKYIPEFYLQPHFVIVYLDIAERVKDDKSMLSIEQRRAIIAEKLSAEHILAQVIHKEHNQFVAWIGLAQPSDRAKLLKTLSSIATNLSKNELSKYTITAFISKLYTSDIVNCVRAYQEVLHASGYRLLNESSAVIDVDRIEVDWNVYLPLEQLEKLSNCLLRGEVAESMELIEETLKENVERNVHLHQLMHIVNSIFFYMMRHAAQSVEHSRELQQLEVRFFEKLKYSNDLNSIKQALFDVAKYIGKQSKQEMQSKLNPAFISQYIELHYMESMHLDHLAEVVGTSAKYFSRYFRKTFGVNYIEYLNKVRLSHAKELLRDTHLSIAEIGEKTGYLNTSTFSATFRKYFGISPSEYRSQLHQ